jgi:hypothetical protein
VLAEVTSDAVSERLTERERRVASANPAKKVVHAVRSAITGGRDRVNATVPSPEDAPLGYEQFYAGVPKRFVVDSQSMLGAA